jgi:hypothetical protein
MSTDNFPQANATIRVPWPGKDRALEPGEAIYACAARAKNFISVTALPPNPRAGERWNVPQAHIEMHGELPPYAKDVPLDLSIKALPGKVQKRDGSGLHPAYKPARNAVAEISLARVTRQLTNLADARKLLSDVAAAVEERAREKAGRTARKEGTMQGLEGEALEAYVRREQDLAIGEESAAKVLIVAAKETVAIHQLEQEGEELRTLRQEVEALKERRLRAINGGQET